MEPRAYLIIALGIVLISTTTIVAIYFYLKSNKRAKILRENQSIYPKIVDKIITDIERPFYNILGNINELLSDQELSAIHPILISSYKTSAELIIQVGKLQVINKVKNNNLELKNQVFSYKLYIEELGYLVSSLYKGRSISINVPEEIDPSECLVFDQMLLNTTILNIFEYLISESSKTALSLTVNKEGKNITFVFTGASEKALDRISKLYAAKHIAAIDDGEEGIFSALESSKVMQGKLKLKKELSISYKFDSISEEVAEEYILDLADKKILIVDDCDASKELLKLYLKSQPCKIDMCSNGIQALKQVEEKVYDLIIMDVQMPLMDGITATKKIREKEVRKEHQTPIITVSALTKGEEIKRCKEVGANAVLSKPVKREVLHNTICKVIC